jgi:hypothetical protein
MTSINVFIRETKKAYSFRESPTGEQVIIETKMKKN